GRSQSLTKFNGAEKLIWPVLSLEPRYNLDKENITITGGGNGPYYALQPRSEETPILYILGILSHPIIESYVRSRASVFRGGYGSHGKQFIAEIPIPKYEDKFSIIPKWTKEIIDVRKEITFSKMDKQTTLATRKYHVLMLKLFNEINKLYGFSNDDLKTVFEYQSLERQINRED
ncbi:MAG: endonuclease, partial [Nanoarchaeota archaeon]|nr:endonuclease [Nanoarchaeota archaeon]